MRSVPWLWVALVVPAGALPELCTFDVDPRERFNLAIELTQIVERIRERMRDFARRTDAHLSPEENCA